MEDSQIKNVLEAALLAAGRPLALDKLVQLFASKAPDVDRAVVRNALEALTADYSDRGLQLKEVSSGYRIQIKRSMTTWLEPLWEERAPRYSRALLETLALIAYRQPVTRGEIEEVRGIVVNPNIIRTMLERGWIRVVGYREVPGKPEMFGTTREFLDYFGLKSLDELPELVEINDGFPELSAQVDFVEDIELRRRRAAAAAAPDDGEAPMSEATGESRGVDPIRSAADANDAAESAARARGDEPEVDSGPAEPEPDQLGFDEPERDESEIDDLEAAESETDDLEPAESETDDLEPADLEPGESEIDNLEPGESETDDLEPEELVDTRISERS